LVVKICTAPPNWEKVIRPQYSTAVVALTKSMLEKAPENRPYVKDIVRSDFVKSHISRLLSHTLKVGNGGAAIADAAPLAAAPPSAVDRSLEDLERDLETHARKDRVSAAERVRRETEVSHSPQPPPDLQAIVQMLEYKLSICVHTYTGSRPRRGRRALARRS
jgi:hypothetical protein